MITRAASHSLPFDITAQETLARVFAAYFDFLPYLTTQRRAYKRRTLHGQA